MTANKARRHGLYMTGNRVALAHRGDDNTETECTVDRAGPVVLHEDPSFKWKHCYGDEPCVQHCVRFKCAYG